MGKRHLFSINAPSNWPIPRKEHSWVARPNPGPHPLSKCLPLVIIVKDLLKYARNLREVKAILNANEILIDNKVRKDYKFPVGLMDIISIKKTNESFRLMLDDKNNYVLQKLTKNESNLKPCKIINKTILKGKKMQLNLFDSRNVLVDKNDYKIGDTVVFDLLNKKVVDHLKLEKGCMVYIIEGKYAGYFGKLKEIIIQKGIQDNKVIFTKGKEELQTLKNYVFVVPEDFIK